MWTHLAGFTPYALQAVVMCRSPAYPTNEDGLTGVTSCTLSTSEQPLYNFKHNIEWTFICYSTKRLSRLLGCGMCAGGVGEESGR